MPPIVTGIHHVTAFAKDPIANHRFYTDVLGLRMVKKTVNFDDPLTYHLYFGDDVGSPGTLLTHFPHPHAKLGVHGSPEILETVLTIKNGTLDIWLERLKAQGVTTERDDHTGRITFADHDGMRFALVETDALGTADHSVTGIDSVVIRVPDLAQTRGFLRDAMGFTEADAAAGRSRLVLDDDAPGRRLELIEVPADRRTSMGAGTVHHVAWRVPDDAAQAAAATALNAAGVGVTPVMDRQYFRSIYFRIPGGVVFEIATDGPGFDVDEPRDTLGEALKLPPQYEPRRAELEAHLVPLGTGEHA